MPAWACPDLVATLRGRTFTLALPVDTCCPLNMPFYCQLMMCFLQ